MGKYKGFGGSGMNQNKKVSNVVKQAQLEKDCAAVTLTTADLAEVIEIWTGVPATSIRADEYEQLDKLEDVIKIEELESDNSVCRELILVRVAVNEIQRPEVVSVADIFRANVGEGCD